MDRAACCGFFNRQIWFLHEWLSCSAAAFVWPALDLRVYRLCRCAASGELAGHQVGCCDPRPLVSPAVCLVGAGQGMT